MQNIGNALVAYGALPAMIFCARILDVSMDTLRVACIARGIKPLAAILGMIQVSIWLVAITSTMRHLHNPACFLAYALGFGAGTWVGLLLEERLALGHIIVRTIVPAGAGADDLVAALRGFGFGTTVLEGEGSQGPVEILFTVADRRHRQVITQLITNFDHDVFFTVEEIRGAHQGIGLTGSANGVRRIFSRWTNLETRR